MAKRFKVALAGFHIECVSFLPVISGFADFEKVALRGQEIVAQLRGTNTVMGGFIQTCEEEDIDMMPLVHTALGAVGPASDEAVIRYADEIVAGVRGEGASLSGVLLFLHGACWAPSFPDPERYIIDRVRGALGDDKPLMVAFDYHGNLDQLTVEGLTAAFAYRKSPHTDTGETGRRTADCMARTLRREIDPVLAIAKPGIVVPSIFSATAFEPLAQVIEQGRLMQEASAVYCDISVMAGFSYADAHNTGFSVLCVTDGDRELAEDLSQGLCQHLWEERHALYRPTVLYTVDEAIDRVTARLAETSASKQPFVLLEHADRMNDSTYLLSELLKRKVQKVAVPFIWDEAAALKAFQAGAGQYVSLALGGHSSEKAGPVLHIVGQVLWAGQKSYRVSGAYMRGMPVDLGMTALVDVNGIIVSVVSAFAFAVDGDAFGIFGLKLEDFDIIVLRSKTHFRAFYEPIAREILIVDTPDYGAANLRSLPYQRLQTSTVFPLNVE